MPPAKTRPAQDDLRSDGSTAKERNTASGANARSKKNGASVHQSSNLKEFALTQTEPGIVPTAGQSTGIAWQTTSRELLNNYRVGHHLASPTAFTSPYYQALLTNPGLGRQSPTMARRKEKRRVSKEHLALAVRKNFNSAAVSEIESIVELVYKVRHQDKSFRMRSLPSAAKKL